MPVLCLCCACAVPAVEGGEALPLEELSSLLFDDTSPRSLFVTHRMMQRDALFFKQVRGLGSTKLLLLFTNNTTEHVLTCF